MWGGRGDRGGDGEGGGGAVAGRVPRARLPHVHADVPADRRPPIRPVSPGRRGATAAARRLVLGVGFARATRLELSRGGVRRKNKASVGGRVGGGCVVGWPAMRGGLGEAVLEWPQQREHLPRRSARAAAVCACLPEGNAPARAHGRLHSVHRPGPTVLTRRRTQARGAVAAAGSVASQGPALAGPPPPHVSLPLGAAGAGTDAAVPGPAAGPGPGCVRSKLSSGVKGRPGQIELR